MATGTDDRRTISPVLVVLGLVVACVVVIAATILPRFVELIVFAQYNTEGRAIINNLAKRRPPHVTPRAWEIATTWASIAYCNVCVVGAMNTSEMKNLVADLKAQSQNGVDLSTCSWIWRRLEATGSSGKTYYAKFWPQYRRDLAYAQASDDSLPTLEGLREIQYLDLRGTSVTDAGLVHLKKAESLESLALSAEITDAGLAHLSGSITLRWLSLTGTKVTDRGLDQLQGLPRLEKLYVAGAEITEEGENRFLKRFPNCKIER